jgi:TPR repeat protein
MEEFNRDDDGDLDDFLPLLEKAAVKGHEESMWILNVVKDVEVGYDIWKKAFAATGKPLGWFFAGRMCNWATQEHFEFLKLSAEGGCSWAQDDYAYYFREGVENQGIVEEDKNAFVDWLLTGANQNNPMAMYHLAGWFFEEDYEASLRFYHNAGELGWKESMEQFSLMLYDGVGCEKDIRQAIVWNAKSNNYE